MSFTLVSLFLFFWHWGALSITTFMSSSPFIFLKENMAEYLKKPVKDALDDIKERMKERRNQKWMRLDKISHICTVKGKIATNSSKKIKSLQANNKALAQALQEEKLKLRDAQDTILHLKTDYQDLKFQMFKLQRDLRLKQAQRLENQLQALNKIISRVSQNLQDSVDLLGPAKNLCSIGVNGKVLSSVLENGSSVAGPVHSVKHLQCADGDDQVLPSGMEADSHKNELTPSVSETCEESDNAVSSNKIVPDKGRASDFHLDVIESELENISSSREDGLGNLLPKNGSTRNCSVKSRNYNKHYTGVLNHSEAPASTRKLSELDKVRLEESLQMCTIETRNLGISQLNENEVGSEPVLRKSDSETTESHLNNNSDLKRHESKNREDSQVRKGKHEKAKLEKPKTSRQTPKQGQAKGASKKKLDFLGCFSDAYDFHLEESVHLTPFRQNKVNDTDSGVDDKNDLSETNTIETDDIEEDSDDSLYEPYKSKSKRRKSAVDKIGRLPVCARPRSKRCLAQREQKLHDEKETRSSKSSDKSIRQPSEPSHGHLCNVTNTASLLTSTGNAAVVPEGEGPRSPKRKRSCAITVCYKEPSIAGKLRRGDPFTDTNFLHSPVFKEKSNAKCPSLRKTSLSKYSEKVVGHR
ncbi:shugoshin 1 [Neopsephotus bourkii]|uniref:shugoshin 1 n=1 Tax=Neopsephotus bourkii TaxID=309878 RepID=UPI002AA50860|nr:shugoshin 1 [Neopsephotus bourkii]